MLRLDAAGDETITVVTEDGRIFGPPAKRLNRDFSLLVEKPSGEMESDGRADFLKRIAGHGCFVRPSSRAGG
ncbi:MAG TPA: hypothetical protein VHX68_20330, partial [Planctomycetaceae bacterium]|nr:hypothetical protein [Planctomycetaceae bacterium]